MQLWIIRLFFTFTVHNKAEKLRQEQEKQTPAYFSLNPCATYDIIKVIDTVMNMGMKKGVDLTNFDYLIQGTKVQEFFRSGHCGGTGISD